MEKLKNYIKIGYIISSLIVFIVSSYDYFVNKTDISNFILLLLIVSFLEIYNNNNKNCNKCEK